MKRALFVIALLMLCAILFSQDLANRVIASGGAYSSAGSYSLSYTVGETFVKKFESANTTFTTGFQQYWEFSVGIDDLRVETGLIVYPNPSSDKVYLQLGAVDGIPVSIQVLTLTGERLFARQIERPLQNSIEEIDMSYYSPGIYLLRIANANGYVKTIKLVRQ